MSPSFIWQVPGVDEQPVVFLEAWRVMRLSYPTGFKVYLVGRLMPEFEGRVSSAVLDIHHTCKSDGSGAADNRHRGTFSPTAQAQSGLRALTESGRLYKLSGPSGFDDDGMYVWQRVLRARGITQADCTDITDDPTEWPQAHPRIKT